MINIDILIICV